MKLLLNAALTLLMTTCFISCHIKANIEENEALEMDGMDRAMHQQFMRTIDPATGTVPAERLLLAQQQRDALCAMKTSSITWQERGPTNIGGRTRAILVDKHDASGNTVFAGSVGGGIFKTTNFLSSPPTWTPVDDKMANLAVTVIAQDANNLNTFYAGTGEGWFNVDAVRGAGVFKSTDGGTTWSQIPSTSGFEYIQDIVIDNNGNLYVALRNGSSNNRGVMRSTDGGANWTQVLGAPLPGFNTGRAADLEVASNGDIYACLGIFTRTVVMKSAAINGASTGDINTWVDITPAYANTQKTHRGKIVTASNNPQRVYLMMQDSSNYQVSAFFRSNDGGATWTQNTAPAALNNGTNSQNWYNMALAVDPNNPDIVVAGGYQNARSTNGGTNWTTIGNSIHVDEHILLFATSTRLMIGNDGGIYDSENANASPMSFANKNNTYDVTQFYGVDYHPTLSDFFIAGAQDNNTQKFTSPGLNATTPVVGGDGGIPHIDQLTPNIQIAATYYNNFFLSTDGGNNFNSLVSNSRGQFINPSDYDNNSKSLFSGDNAGKYFCIKNIDGSFSTTNPSVLSMGSRSVTAVKVDPNSANTVWFGASGFNATTPVIPMILKITNATATTPSTSFTVQLPVVGNTTITCVEIDPTNANHMLVTLSNYGIVSIFESNDGGHTWSGIEGNLPDMPIYWIISLPTNVEVNGPGGGGGGALVGTDLGVWYTSGINGSNTVWTPYANFPNVPTYMLKYRASDKMVFAATHGRGVWTATLTQVSTGVSNVNAIKEFIKYTSSVDNRLHIATGTLNTHNIDIQIFDSKGSLVHRETKAYQSTTINTSNWSRGTYIIKIVGDKNEQYMRQFVKQ